MKMMRNDVWLLAVTVAVFSPLVHSQQQLPKIVGPFKNGRLIKVKRHNLQRPVKPVYHSPPINAFSLRDLHKNVDDDFPRPSHSLQLGPRFSKPEGGSSFGGMTSGEERYFASLRRPFSPNLGPQFFSGSGGVPKPSSSSSFGLYGPGFGSIMELYDSKKPQLQYEDVDDDEEAPIRFNYASVTHQPKPYQHNFVYSTTSKPKLLVPSYAHVKPANIKHLGSSGYGYPSNTYSGNHGDEEHGDKDAHYDFGYEVANSGSHGKQLQVFGHGETRHGDVTKGRYHVLLPDGRHQKVAYTADHSGFHAQVSYTNQAHHSHN